MMHSARLVFCSLETCLASFNWSWLMIRRRSRISVKSPLRATFANPFVMRSRRRPGESALATYCPRPWILLSPGNRREVSFSLRVCWKGGSPKDEPDAAPPDKAQQKPVAALPFAATGHCERFTGNVNSRGRLWGRIFRHFLSIWQLFFAGDDIQGLWISWRLDQLCPYRL